MLPKLDMQRVKVEFSMCKTYITLIYLFFPAVPEAGEDYASAGFPRGSTEKRLSQEKRASQENAEASEKRPSQEPEGESGSRRGSRKSGATERKSGAAEANEE